MNRRFSFRFKLLAKTNGKWKIRRKRKTGLASKLNLKRSFPVSYLSDRFLVKLPGKGCRPKNVEFLRTSFPLKISRLILQVKKTDSYISPGIMLSVLFLELKGFWKWKNV